MSYIEYITGDGEGHDQDPLPGLARTNHFTMADLALNRAGKISDKQWMRLLIRALQPVTYTGGALLGWLVCCFVVKVLVPGIVLRILAMLGSQGLGMIFGAISLAAFGAFLVSAIKCAGTTSLLLIDLNAGKASCAEGRVTPSREQEQGLGMARLHGENHTKHYYVVRNEYFEVDEEAHGALPAGMAFRLYYTPKSKLLLSIEPLQG